MSTGLTYLSFSDNSVENPLNGTANFIFNDYQEAREFGAWYIKYFASTSSNHFIVIWTSSPNQNGYYKNVADEAVFVAVD